MESGMKFEEKMAKLESLINELEKDNKQIDDSIEIYKEAVGLVNECDKQLKAIEEQVSKMVTEDGKLVDFEITE